MAGLSGNFKGGYGKTTGAKNVKGYDSGTNGRGTMPYKSTLAKTATKDMVGVGENAPMPHGENGRVLYSSANKRIGRQEGTGKAS
jgi:hypothetical protein